MAAVGLCFGLVAAWSPGAGLAAGGARPANGGSPVHVDVDGDGRADLLIGSFSALQVRYGDGVRQRIAVGLLRPRRDYTGFGAGIAACDVNGDGYSDAVVGAAAATVAGADLAGRVVVFYGAASGLSPRRTSVISQESPGVPGRSESWELFGHAVGCGHINGDRFDDVVVGGTGESWRAHSFAGRVVVVPGGVDGVVTTRSWAFTEDSTGIPDRAEDYDSFGQSLLVDDVTGDGWDDLIVGASEPGASGVPPGALFVLPGTRSGVRVRDTTVIYGQTHGLPHLLGSIVAGNFDRRGPRDVVVGSLHEGTLKFTDAVTMLPGTPSGLTTTGSRTIRRDSRGMPPMHRSFETFGSLAAGDVDGDGDDDLLSGSPYETFRGRQEAGRVFLIRGSTGGITTDGVQQFSQATPGTPGRVHRYGHFGRCVELVDLDGDRRSEALIASDERIHRDHSSVGAVTILRASPTGLTGNRARRLDPADFGATTRRAGAGFGCDLAG
jgi:hypothetical protein